MARPTATTTPARRPSLPQALRAERHRLAAAHKTQAGRDGPGDRETRGDTGCQALGTAPSARRGRDRQMAVTSKTW